MTAPSTSCFFSLVNRMNTMPVDMITKLVSDFYDDKEVVVAKECLLGHLPPTNTSQRQVRRKGANKKTMNIQDILHILLNFEVEDIPCFVTRAFSNLTRLTQDHFVLASVMRNLSHMQHELCTLATLKDYMTILQARMTDFTQRRHADDNDNQIIQTQDDKRSADPDVTPARVIFFYACSGQGQFSSGQLSSGQRPLSTN